MKKNIVLNATVAMLVVAPVSAAFAVENIMYEEQVAHQEEMRIIESPIGGVQNKNWFNYRANVNETRKELASDLRHATDIEDQRDAWGEYATELHDERGKYVNFMSKRGYRMPQVYFENL